MLQLVLFSALASIVVQANLADGQKFRGELQAISTGEVVLKANGQVRTFARQELRDVAFPKADEGTPEAFAFVQLIDGSVVPCDGVRLTEGQLAVRSSLGDWSAPDTTVRAIRWPLYGEKTDEEWNEILDKAASEDLLVIRRDTSLDYLSGVVAGVSEQAIHFEYSGNTIPVPFSKAAGIILAGKGETLPNPRMRLSTRAGGQWMLESVVIKGDKLSLVSVARVERQIPLSEISRVEFPQLDAVFMSGLEPSSVKFVPFFGSSEIGETLEQFGRPRLDRSFDGTAIRLSDSASVTGWRPFRRGLAIQSKTEMVYRLAAKYRRFRATVGIDPQAASQANVELLFIADNDVVFNRSIDKDNEPIDVDVDVTNARRLTLVVDYGENLHIGDRVHLGDARLTK